MLRPRYTGLIVVSLAAIAAVYYLWPAQPQRDELVPATVLTVAPTEEAAQPDPQPTGELPWLTGLVLDAHTRAPLAGASVELTGESRDNGAELRELAFAKTDAMGRFTIDEGNVPAASYSVIVTRSGYLSERADTSASQGTSGQQVKTVLLVPGAIVRGVVVHEDGTAATSATVELHDRLRATSVRVSASNWPTAVPVAQDGSFELTATGPLFLVAARLDGFRVATAGPFRCRPEPRDGIELVMTLGDVITGQVLDQFREPVSQVTVRTTIRREDCDLVSSRLQTLTDQSGRFVLEGIPPGREAVQLSLSSVEGTGAQVRAFRGDDIEVLFWRGRRLRFRLVNGEGSPLSNVGLPLIGMRTGSAQATPETDQEAGTYLSSAVPPVVQTGQLEVFGFLPQPVSWEPGVGVLDLGEIVLRRGPRMTITVEDQNGFPAAGRSVYATPPNQDLGQQLRGLLREWFGARTDEDGVVEHTGFLEGPHVISVTRPDIGVQKFDRTFSYDYPNITVRLSEPGAIKLRVLGFDPLRRHPEIQPRRSTFRLSERTHVADDSGLFVLDPLASGKRQEFKVVAPGCIPEPLTVDALSHGERRVLPDLQLRKGSTLQALVTNAQGHLLGGVRVSIRAEQLDHYEQYPRDMHRFAVTDADGLVLVDDVAPGRYMISISHRNYGAGSKLVRTDSDPVHIRLGKVRFHRHRLTFDDGEPVAGRFVYLESDTDPDRDREWIQIRAFTTHEGWVQLPESMPGPVRLRVENDQPHWVFRAARIPNLPKEIRVPRLSTLRIALVDVHGDPFLGRAMVTVAAPNDDERRRLWDMASLTYDDEGFYLSVEGLLGGEVDLHVRAPGFLPVSQRLSLASGQVTPVLVELRRPGVVTPCVVEVVDALGEPIQGAVVTFNAPEFDPDNLFSALYDEWVYGVTDADGLTSVLVFSEATYTIEAAKDGLRLEQPPPRTRLGGRIYGATCHSTSGRNAWRIATPSP